MERNYVNGLRWTADGQADHEPHEDKLARAKQQAGDATAAAATVAENAPRTPQQRASMTAAELLSRGPGNMTDAEARDYRDGQALQATIDAKAASATPTVATPFTAEQRAAASPMQLLANGVAVDDAAAARLQAELDELRRRAAS